MDEVNISDPSDWLNTRLTVFAPLESALRCQVCKDFYRTPVITSCNHTFCSLCIRRCLSADGKCPICRLSDQASKLRRNLVVEEVVARFESARPVVIELAAPQTKEPGLEDEVSSHKPRKRRKVNGKEMNGTGTSARQTRSSMRKQNQSSQEPSPIDGGDVQMRATHTATAEQTEEPNDGLVACPICASRMKEDFVFGHLSHCNGVKSPDPPRQPPKRDKTDPRHAPRSDLPVHLSAPSQSQQRPRLPEIQFDLMKDTALRKRLHDQGIPDWGPRDLLKRRYIEWINIWNAECDSDHPRSKRALLRDLDDWERTLGGLARDRQTGANNNFVTPGGGGASGGGHGGGQASAQARGSKGNKVDFDHKAYATAHKSDFDRLIEEARRKAKTTKAQTADVTKKDDKEDVSAGRVEQWRQSVKSAREAAARRSRESAATELPHEYAKSHESYSSDMESPMDIIWGKGNW